jgi:beta-glucosidase
MTTSEITDVGSDAATDAAVFPRSFLWGAATSAYQIEGAVTADGRRSSIWDTFSHTPGLTANGETGDVACDHYRRWRDDVQLLSDLRMNAYRMSVPWVRLQPTGAGPLDQGAVAHYRAVLERLHELGVRPLLTLYHWDLPQDLEDRGGWPSRETAERFAEYAGLVVGSLGDLCADWIPINEPWCVSFLGYGEGAHAPGRRSPTDAVAAAHHLNLAHGLAVSAIRSVRAGMAVGPTNLVTDLVPASDHPDDEAATTRVDLNHNRFFLDPVLRGSYPDELFELYRDQGLAELVRDGDEHLIAAPCDFVGVNHYHQIVVAADDTDSHLGARQSPAQPATTSFGWSVRPESLTNVLCRIADEYSSLPIYVTENGASFDDEVGHDGRVLDRQRIDYLDGYLDAAARAITKGVDLRGYFAWSLLDNFEWAHGYAHRFGIVHVDFATQERLVRESGHFWSEMARTGQLPSPPS